VKLIGDEAMFVVVDPAAACAVALEVVEALSGHPVLPSARAGLASGEVLVREGDFFGPVVNLAARVVKLATPGTVVASDEVAGSCEGYRFASIGGQELRGFDDPVELHRVERA